MLRALAQIILSIQLSAQPQTKLPETRIEMLANCIQQQAMSADVDPFIIVAIITHESQWRERVISDDGFDYGLMQVRAIYYGGSSSDLLIGENNIKVGAYQIKLSKEYCRNKLHREPTTEEWLAPYQGGKPSGYNCTPTKMTKQVVAFATCLKDNVENNAGHFCQQIFWPWMTQPKNSQ